jgi:hypothetical protein
MDLFGFRDGFVGVEEIVMAHPRQPPPVQFRPGPLLGRWLAKLASAWRTNENDVAKRLAAVAACELELDQYGGLPDGGRLRAGV